MCEKFLLSSILIALWTLVLSNPSCPKLKPGMINVHLVCHTHDDVGWLKTVDEYYYGSKKHITWVGVQYILDSVIQSLLRDKSRKFSYVESAFFFRWWNEQDDNIKTTVKNLVESGQFEFINGGWCMNDEAAAHYNAIIDQMTYGLAKLNETFGEAAFPRIAWQIDPFGHSKEQASLFAQMGMDGLFFGRLDYDDKSKRWESKQMEMIWKASNSLGENAWLFTGALPNGYSPPKGFCFDLLCPNDPIMDDPALEDYNKDTMVNQFLIEVEYQKKAYATSNLIMTMGEDFNYVYAESWYKNLDKLIKYVNARQENGSKVNLVYSTPSCYLDALHDADIKWQTKNDDFFPYASDPHAFWTGYFTSRPTLKGFIRKSNNILQAVKQISALVGLERGPYIEKLSKAMAVTQHHDSVTGTAQQHVTDDYSKRLSEGVAAAGDALSEGFRILTQSSNSLLRAIKFEYCPLLNISACPISEKLDSFVVNIYNPVSRPINHYIRVPVVKALQYKVIDAEGNELEADLIPLPKPVLDIPGRKSEAKLELVFYAEDLPALGTKQYSVSTNGQSLPLENIKSKALDTNKDEIITKGDISLILDARSRKLKSIDVLSANGVHKKLNISQDWKWYAGMKGNNTENKFRASGAYIFRPDGPINDFTDNVKITGIYDGTHVAEVHQEWSPWVTQILRVYAKKKYIEIEWLVGSIPTDDGIGKEIVSRVDLGEMLTNQTFYTDANGRELQKRIKDFRPTWKLNQTEPVSQNYYPVTSRIIISSINNKGTAAIMNDRSQGGTSLSDGQMELMVHRRLLYDDAFGVGEPLNETAFGKGLVARGRHIILHSDFTSDDCDFGCLHRRLGEELLLQPLLTFSPPTSFFRRSQISKKSTLTTPLPSNIRILTLEPWRRGEWLLRLENYYEKGESNLSGTSSVDIKNLFADWMIASIEEVALGANQLSAKIQRLKWKTADDTIKSSIAKEFGFKTENGTADQSLYKFSPMQIRTFIIKVSSK